MERFSVKRQSILDYLCASKEHPSADQIYAALKSVHPNLSLGTVYRNLAQLKEEGQIISVGDVHGQERYDGNTVPHSHVVCSHCGAVTDVDAATVPEAWIAAVSQQTGFRIHSASLLFTGLCQRCVQALSTSSKSD